MTDPILLRYAQAATPRYTSYPTAPHFDAAVDAGTYARWLSELRPAARGSLYMHVPYCRTMCWYCGCHTRATRQSAPVAQYLDRLEREAAIVAAHIPHRLDVGHVHWGGGTPTLAGAERLVRFMALLRGAFAISDTAEIAIEVDPRSMSPSLAAALGDAGFNRASLGVQTLDDTVQRAINRIQDFETTRLWADRLRAAGIRALNLDLLYGLPRQTVASCRDTASKVLDLEPDRLSVFGYAHVPHMKPHQRMIDTADLPHAGARIDQALALAEVLTDAGYVAIGLDHYARPGDALARAAASGRLRRNFQGYTTDAAEALIGLGASAIGRLPQGYVQNAAATGRWADAVDDGRPATARGIALDAEDRMRAAIIERLMCDLAVDLEMVGRDHGRDPPTAELDTFEAAGVVRRDGGRIAIDPRYRMLARNVAAAFDARLASGAARHSPSV